MKTFTNQILFYVFFLLLIFIFPIAQSQENLALIADSLETSYVSTWESLNAINDNFEPASSMDHSHGAYGNWKSGVTNEWNWVEYDFDQFYKIYQSDVYWWTDQTDITTTVGVQIPYDCYIEYWDFLNQTWKEVKNPTGYGIEKDKFNVTTFDTVLTNKIRLHFVSLSAQGIIEWKVFGILGEQVPSLSTITINTPLAKNSTSTIIATAIDKDGIPVTGYVFKLNAEIKNAIVTTGESYSIDGSMFTTTQLGALLAATNTEGKVSFDVSIPATIDPKDGLDLSILFNDGITTIHTFSIKEPGLLPPALTADNTLNNVDNDIDITFSDNALWRSAVSSVFVDGTELEATDYSFTTGTLTLKPSNGNVALTKAGSKTIIVSAAGYDDTQVTQEITCGEIDATTSSVGTNLKLYKSATIPFTVLAKDSYGNPIEGYVFKWDALVTNATVTTSETYILNGEILNSNTTDMELPATDTNGAVTFSVSIPSIVDLGDGITISVQLADGTTDITPSISYTAQVGEKTIYIPSDLKSHKEWSYSKTAQSDNFVLFWGNLVGADPKNPANGDDNIDFDPEDILTKLEKYYALYTDTFNFIPNKNEGNMSKYKFVITITDTWADGGYSGGWATGGSVDGVIGAMWVHPNATSGSGFVIAHEFAHSCQAMVPIQYPGKGIKDTDDAVFSMFWESHANFMALTATKDMSGVSAERWVNTAMMHFSSYRHAYQNIYFLQYLYDTYGMEEINKIWLNADEGEHPLEVLKKNKSYSQDDLNNDFGYYAMHNVSWDYSTHDIIKNYLNAEGAAYVCREFTVLDTIQGKPGHYIIPRQLAPGDYGYNIIPLYPNDNATEITITFSGYDNANAGGAGWRYGFVAVDKNGEPRYSNLYSAQNGTATFTLNADDSSVYLVVTGAPQTHHNYSDWEPGWPKIYRYPYGLEISGALPEGYKTGYNSQKSEYPGAAHANGGGWVAATATVSATAYVGPNAQVLGNATVSDNARIEDYAIVTDNAAISGNAVVRGHAIVGSTSKVRQNGIVEESSRVYLASDIYGDARITGSTIVHYSKVYGNAVVKDLAWLYNASLSGSIVAGGDAEDLTTCSAGTYLQLNSLRNCDGKDVHKLNTDVNPLIEDYIYPNGEFPTSPLNLSASNITSTTVDLSWNASTDDLGIDSYLVINGTSSAGLTTGESITLTDLTPETSYTFTAIARDIAGNESGQSNSVTITTGVSGIEPIDENSSFRLFPNPANKEVTVEFDKNEEAEISIYDNLGRCLLNRNIRGSETISLEEIGAKGIYFVKVYSNNTSLLQKLFIQ